MESIRISLGSTRHSGKLMPFIHLNLFATHLNLAKAYTVIGQSKLAYEHARIFSSIEKYDRNCSCFFFGYSQMSISRVQKLSVFFAPAREAKLIPLLFLYVLEATRTE
jgi:hypothetical protein